MKLFIPDLQTPLKLLTEWRFGLCPEYRNEDFALRLGVFEGDPRDSRRGFARNQVWLNADGSKYIGDRGKPYREVSLPAGTVVQIERYYIKRGLTDYNSVTFRIKQCPEIPRLKGARFWAKLYDTSSMEIELASTQVVKSNRKVEINNI